MSQEVEESEKRWIHDFYYSAKQNEILIKQAEGFNNYSGSRNTINGIPYTQMVSTGEPAPDGFDDVKYICTAHLSLANKD